MPQPLVWTLLGRKAGDNTQVLALADELGWPCERKTVLARSWEILVQLARRPTLAGIDRSRSSTLRAPWPDLVITAGRRNEPVARWIREQSGGRCALVHVGRPWSDLGCWDLVITTPLYFLPVAPNVLHNELPLHRLLPGELEAAALALAPRIADLSRPLIAILVGGDSGRFVFTPEKGEALGRAAVALARVRGASLLLTNSPRTPAGAWRALREAISVPAYTWSFGDADDNPYRGFLASADEFIVTGESMSMLAEATAMGRPVHVFDVGDGEQAWWRHAHNYRVKPLSHHLAMAVGPRQLRRDVGRIQQALVESGRANWLGQPGAGVVNDRGDDELRRTADRVREMMAVRLGGG